MPGVVIRAATVADASVIAGLHADSWRNAYRGILPDSYIGGSVVEDRRRVWAERLEGDDPERLAVFLATERDVPVGFACVLLDDDPERGSCLDNLHVLPEHHGRGIGRHLLARAAAWTSAQAPGRPWHLWVFEENGQARRFYDLLEGIVVARGGVEVGGVTVPSLCYTWSDLDALAQRARNGGTEVP
jgi:GNAT superfamily N-acetyltransferase